MIYDEDAGEVIRDKFAQLYFNDIEKLFGLTSTGVNVLFLMSKAIGLGNNSSKGGYIVMNVARKKEFAAKLKLKSYRTIDKATRELVGSDIIKKMYPDDDRDQKYIINPDILFSGNDYQRVKVMIEYSDGKRKVKAFTNEKALMSYIENQMKMQEGNSK